jgi:integrase/recombinase XerC
VTAEAVAAPVDVAGIVAGYAGWMRSWGASERTIDARCKVARSRLNAWGLEGLTPMNIQVYLGHDPTWSKWTRATYYSNIKSLCDFLVRAGTLQSSPMDEVRKSKRPGPAPRPLSEAEAARVMAAATGRTRDWIQLALLAGLRAHEIAKLRGEDVTADGLYVLGTGGTEATLPLHPELVEMSYRYPQRGYWFPSRTGGHIHPQTVTTTVSQLFDTLGIAGSIHRCRHNYATRLLRTGVNIRVVQKLMRHGSLQTVEAYTAVDEDELAAAIALLPSG